MSTFNNNARGRGGGGGGGFRGNKRMPPGGSVTGSWRTSIAGDSAAPSPAPAPSNTSAPGSEPSAGGAAPGGKPARPRTNSHRGKPVSRKNSVADGIAGPPAIAVVPPQPSTPIATPTTPSSKTSGGNAPGSGSGRARGRKASNASTLAPLSSSAQSSGSLPPIASAPPNSTGFGTRTDIDAFVQSARANLLGHDGKHTWADDDDELPDLDDWDIDNKSTASGVSSNVLVVKPDASPATSIVTAPVTGPSLFAQQRAAQDRLSVNNDSKKSKRGGKGKNKTETGPPAQAGTPNSKPRQLPKAKTPTPKSVTPPNATPVIPAVNPSTQPVQPVVTSARAPPPPVQLPKIKPVPNTPGGGAPLLPSPVFATLNPPVSSFRTPLDRIRNHLQAGDPPSVVFTGIPTPQPASERATTKPPSPVADRARPDNIVRLPTSSPKNKPSGGMPLPPSTPQGGSGGLPHHQHGRSPSGHSQSSPRQRPNGVPPTGRLSPKSHARTPSATRPKISVNALFQLNRSIVSNVTPKGPSPVRGGAVPSPAVTVD